MNNEILTRYINLCNDNLLSYLSVSHNEYKIIGDAMIYSLANGGKRLRPVMLFAFCNICGISENMGINSACALEFIHTYSLIHDDLPAMDNSDFRRGNLSNHKKFDEATAILAGDALLTESFNIVCKDTKLPDSVKVKIISMLSEFAGYNGMIGGQVLDIANETISVNLDRLDLTNTLKTAKLFSIAGVIACIISNQEDKISNVISALTKIGISFQIRDDILDKTSTCEELGKQVNLDLNKNNYLSIYSIVEANEVIKTLTNQAKEELLEVFDIEKCDFVFWLFDYLLNRNK